jgi:hypothetical protein
MIANCKNCRYFAHNHSECRRHAPRGARGLNYHNSELLRDVAWSMRNMANIEAPKEDDTSDDLNIEAYQLSLRWPFVEDTDWCGEFSEQT